MITVKDNSAKEINAALIAMYHSVQNVEQISNSTQNTIHNIINNSGAGFAVCSTDEATQQKVITIDGIDELKEGQQITVLFSTACSVASPTLNLNGLGAKSIKSILRGTIADIPVHTGYWDFDTTGTATTRVWQANTMLSLVYTSGYWLVMGNPLVCSAVSDNNSYSVYSDGQCHQWTHIEKGSNISPANNWNFTFTKFIDCSNLRVDCLIGTSNDAGGCEVKFRYSTSTTSSLVLGVYNRNTGTNLVSPIAYCYTMGY